MSSLPLLVLLVPCSAAEIAAIAAALLFSGSFMSFEIELGLYPVKEDWSAAVLLPLWIASMMLSLVAGVMKRAFSSVLSAADGFL